MLILVRHGQTTANAGGLLSGRVDVDLTDVGRAQAAAAAAAVGAVDRIVSSPLRRAVDTANAWASPVDIDDRFIELHYGEYDGQPMRSVPSPVWAKWRSDLGFAPPGGESIEALGIRVRAALDDLADEARERDILVVSHVSPIKAAVAWALGVSDDVAWRMHLATASITRIAVGPNGPSLHAFNDIAHHP